jgi:lipopolysaccharide transport system permease protein
MGMQFLFWLTPVVYMSQIIPEKYLWIIKLNPMYYIVSLYHDIFAFCKTPEIHNIVIAFLSTVIIFGIGLFVLSRAEPDMADAL